MRRLSLIALIATLLTPVAAMAGNTIDATLIPDGTYTVKVEKVQDAQHILVKMDNGAETTLTPAAGKSFGKIKPNDNVKLSILKGKVPVFVIQ
ncbi:MAG: hypothetical protein M3Y21_01580 [Candidatus Eremiobacteraeota bacterium]|nr:hypothetical protein [Candidatus Eremiobacteraeota bacterium]